MRETGEAAGDFPGTAWALLVCHRFAGGVSAAAFFAASVVLERMNAGCHFG